MHLQARDRLRNKWNRNTLFVDDGVRLAIRLPCGDTVNVCLPAELHVKVRMKYMLC